MNIRLLSAILVFIVCGVSNVFSQSVVTPTTNACLCDGSVSFSSSSSAAALFTIYDYQGATVATINSINGQFTQGNLCSQPYSFTMVQNGQTTTHVFNVPAVGLNPGNSAMVDICSTAGSLNLNNQLTGILAGGTWQDPTGQVIPNILSSSIAQDGWYTYSLNSGGCNVITGLLVNQIQNACPGAASTPLVCESDAPSLLFDWIPDSQICGPPETGGHWITAAGVPMDGWFHPATMPSQAFYYVIDNVVGCDPVYCQVTVQVNPVAHSGTNSSLTICQNAAPVSLINYMGGNPQTVGTWYNPNNVQVSGTFNPATQMAGIYTYLVPGQTPCVSTSSTLTITILADNPNGQSGNVSLCVNNNPINMIDFLGGNPLQGGTWRNSANQIVDGIFNPANEPQGNYTYSYPSVGCSTQQSVLSITVQQLPNAGSDNNVDICASVGTFNLNSLLSSGVTAGGVWTNSNNQVVQNPINIDASIPTQTYTYTASNTSCPTDQATFSLNIVSQQEPLEDISVSYCSTNPAVDLMDYYLDFPLVHFTTLGGAPVSNIFDPSVQSSVTYRAINPDAGGCLGSQALLHITVEEPAFQTGSTVIDLCQSIGVYDLNLSANNIDFQNGQWQNSTGQAISNLLNLNFLGMQIFEFVSDIELICASSTYEVMLTVSETNYAGEDNSVTLCNSSPSQTMTALAGSLGTGNGNWYSNGSQYLETSFNPAIDNSGTYSYVVPANGACPADTSDLHIQVQYGINYDAGENITQCFGSLPAQLGQQGNAGTSYLWNPSTNLSSNTSATPIVNFYSSNIQPITVQYIVTVNDGVCTIEDQVSVTTLPRPASNFPQEYQICRGESVNLSVFGDNLSCNWLPVALFDNNTNQFQLVEPESTTDVEVTISNEWGCVAYDSTRITVHQLPQVGFIPEAIPGCPPLQVHYEYYPVSGEIISWNIPGVGNFYGNELNTTLTSTGIYDLTLSATSAFGCSRIVHYSQMMEVYEVPFADFILSPEKITTVDPIAKFTNTSFGAQSYVWDFNGLGTRTEISPSFEFPNEDPTTFTVCLEAENEFGCLDTSCKFLPLQNIYIFYAPTAITPDNDGINDGFRPIILGFEESTYTLRIYNRWGEMIFETHDVNESWRGNSNGGDYYVPEGVYTWRVEVKEKIIANFEVFQGHITVIR